MTEYSYGPCWTLGSRKSDRLTFARGCATPAPALPRYVSATASALAAGLALIACTTCAAVLESAPVAFVARLTTMSLPVTLTDKGELGAPGLRNSAVMSLPPSWPHARDVRTTVWLCAVAPDGALPIGSPPLMFACDLR